MIRLSPKAVFRWLDAPAEVRSEVKSLSFPDWYAAAYQPLGLAVVGLALFAPVVAARLLFDHADALPSARLGEAYFYSANHGLGVFAFAISLPLLVFPLSVLLLAAAFPRLMTYATLRGLADPPKGRVAVTRAVRWLYRRAGRAASRGAPEGYIARLQRRVMLHFAVPGAILALLGGAVCAVDLAGYSLGTADGVVVHSLFGAERAAWDQVRVVRVGCDYIESGPLGRYDIEMSSGLEVSAIRLHTTPTELRRIVRLDHELRARGVRVERASTSGVSVRPWWDPSCPAQLAAAAGVDGSALGSLFQPTEVGTPAPARPPRP